MTSQPARTTRAHGAGFDEGAISARKERSMNYPFTAPIAEASDDLPIEDLKEMAHNYPRMDFKAAIKLGDGAGAPAYGWVQSLKVIGDKLWASGDAQCKEVASARQLGTRRVVAEVFHGLKRGGRLYRRALRSVAIRDLRLPAVALQPSGVVEFAAAEGDFAAVKSYTLEAEE